MCALPRLHLDAVVVADEVQDRVHERRPPRVADDLRAEDDVAELARYARRQRLSAVDRKRERIGLLVHAEMVALELLVPYGREGVLNELRQVGGVERTEYTERGTLARGRAPRQVVHRFEEYLVS